MSPQQENCVIFWDMVPEEGAQNARKNSFQVNIFSPKLILFTKQKQHNLQFLQHY